MNTFSRLEALQTEDFRLLCFYAYMLAQTDTESLLAGTDMSHKITASELLKMIGNE